MRPQVTHIETQKVEIDREVTGYEAEELLRKYSLPTNYSTREENTNINTNLSFEELIKIEEEKRQREIQNKNSRENGPKPITFGRENGYETRTIYKSDDEDGFNFKIEISTDMNLPK